jgi:hydrogenase maturation protease
MEEDLIEQPNALLSKKAPMKTLIIGIGNPGRGDDGLGPALVERLAGAAAGTWPEGSIIEPPEGISALWKYQLNIEDAGLIRDFDRVVFADASMEENEPATLKEITPAASITFTTHELSPAAVLALSEELYDRAPSAFLLSIPGFSWDLAEGLSDGARRNLDRAVDLLRDHLERL